MSVRLACASIDWASFAQEWRTSYYEVTTTHSKHKDNDPSTFKTVDDHHLESLQWLLAQHGIEQLWATEEVIAISRVWHFLDGWSDSTPGLEALKTDGYVVCTLSNSNTSLLEDMSEFANLPWSRLFCAETFHKYKPDPSVYLDACKALGLAPSDCAMVAAHLGDLQAAKNCGLQTIYIERSSEEPWSSEQVREARAQDWVDLWIKFDERTNGGGILEIAAQLGEKTTAKQCPEREAAQSVRCQHL